MATSQKVLLLGATGETGGDVLNGLLEETIRELSKLNSQGWFVLISVFKILIFVQA